MLAIIGFMPTPGQGTIGSLDYSADERKKLARKSAAFYCERCGMTVSLLKAESAEEGEGDGAGGGGTAEEKNVKKEAEEIIKNFAFKVNTLFLVERGGRSTFGISDKKNY